MSDTVWLRTHRQGVALTLHIQPGAKKTGIVGLHGDALKIRLAAPPVDGKANEALLGFLAERLGLPRAALSLKSGQTSRRKVVAVTMTEADAGQGAKGMGSVKSLESAFEARVRRALMPASASSDRARGQPA